MIPSQNDNVEVNRIVKELDLQPHPEGGFFRETFRHVHPNGERGACTAIYYLLPGGQFSAWHRVLDADEVWCFHGGASLELAIRDPEGTECVYRLGTHVLMGERPQVVVPRGYWQRARSVGEWSLTTCVVAPAFQFSAFEMKAPGEVF